VNHRTPRELEAICLRALSRDKGLRQGSALEFAEELRRNFLHPPMNAHGA
jgi:hypothetical protein